MQISTRHASLFGGSSIIALDIAILVAITSIGRKLLFQA